MRIDFSQLQTYIFCPKRYHYKYIEKIRKREVEEPEQSRNFGSEIHHALAIYFNKRNIEEAVAHFSNNYQHIENEKIRTTEHGGILLREFVKWWSANFSNAEVLSIEVVDEYAIGNITWIVKVDCIIKMNNNIYVVDFKTTTSKTHYFFLQFDPNMQVSGYCNYVAKQYGNCSGFIPMAMQLGYRKNKYKGEPAGFWCKFDYDIVNRTKEQLKDFENNVSDWYWKLANNTGFPKNEGNCMQYKGCSYRALCISCDDQSIKENMYKLHEPLAYLKEVNDV